VLAIVKAFTLPALWFAWWWLLLAAHARASAPELQGSEMPDICHHTWLSMPGQLAASRLVNCVDRFQPAHGFFCESDERLSY